jgi:GTPase SAR1 family protein
MKAKRIVVCGVSGGGKSTWIERVSSGHFNANHGTEQLNMKMKGCEFIEEDYNVNTECDGVIVFDNHDLDYYMNMRNVDKKVVVVISKCDVICPEMTKSTGIAWHKYKKQGNHLIFEMSSLSNYNFDKPINAFVS